MQRFICLCLPGARIKGFVFVWVTIDVTEHRDQRMFGSKELISFTVLYMSSLARAVRAGAWRRELIQRPWRGASFWLTLKPLS